MNGPTLRPALKQRVPFCETALPRTVAALEAQENAPARRLIERLPRHHADESVLDRLVVALFPHLWLDLQRHIEEDGPALDGIQTAEGIARLDGAIASMVPVLAALYPALLRQVRETGERVPEVVAAALASIVQSI